MLKIFNEMDKLTTHVINMEILMNIFISKNLLQIDVEYIQLIPMDEEYYEDNEVDFLVNSTLLERIVIK